MTVQSSLSTTTPNLQEIDQQAFGALTEPYRRELRTHCYRMLGCLHEAEDSAQETLVRAWRRRETYQGRAPLRAWLYKIATNHCLDILKARPRRTLPIARQAAATRDDPIPPGITEPIWLEPVPEEWWASDIDNPETRFMMRESVALAFLASLHLLPPRQRAVLILRDVLDWQADEVADLLGGTVAAVKSALHRARARLAQYQRTLPGESLSSRPSDEQLHGKLEQYVQAWETADVDGLLTLLKSDATFSMPPIPAWYQGRETIGWLTGKTVFSGPARGRWRLLPTRANGQPAFGLYRLDESGASYSAYGIQVVTFSGEEIADITTFRNPPLAAAFNLPSTFPA